MYDDIKLQTNAEGGAIKRTSNENVEKYTDNIQIRNASNILFKTYNTTYQNSKNSTNVEDIKQKEEGNKTSEKVPDFKLIPKTYNLVGIRSLVSPRLLHALAS